MLPLRERADAVGDRRRRQPRVDDAPAGVDLADRTAELLGGRVLEQEAEAPFSSARRR